MRLLLAAMLSLVAASASAQLPEVVVAGDLDICLIILPCATGRTEWIGFGAGHRVDQPSDIHVIASAPGGRMLALLQGTPLRVVEIHPDNSRVPVATLAGYRGYELVVAASGAFYVRALSNGGEQILAFGPGGNHLATYAIPFFGPQPGHSFDLGADQCTLFYGRAGDVKRFNVCSGTALPDLLRLPGSAYTTDIDVLPNGDLLLATTAGTLHRYTPGGTLVRTYAVPDRELHTVGLTEGGNVALVMSAHFQSDLIRIDLATGATRTLTTLGVNVPRSVNARFGWTAALGHLHGGANVPALSTWAMIVLAAALGLLTLRRL